MAALKRAGAAGALVRALWVATGCGGAWLLAGCAVPVPAPDRQAPAAAAPAVTAEPPAAAAPPGVPYHCEGELRIAVRVTGDAAQVSGLPQGQETLLRDAGGVTPEQSVWSNPRLRAEFGLGPDGRQALLQFLPPAVGELRCTRSGDG